MELATERIPHAEPITPEPAEDGIDFHGFVLARSAVLFRGALVLTGNREAAEDLVQETLERACRKWRTIAAKDAPDAYVRRIMVNLANDRWRRFHRTLAHQDGGDRAAPGDDYGQVDARDQSWVLGIVATPQFKGCDGFRDPREPEAAGAEEA
ncbi:sigma factor, partial [Streptomyces sp. NPDC001822]|uniref:sigma factor n=1 Tax=Streptomyces sp. NPDC001822 TaxID=3364614 RepID=UPI0036897093